jgi:hypothetical protein
MRSLSKLVPKRPSVLGGTIATNFEPTNKLSLLQERLLPTLDDKSLSKLVPKQPPALGGAIATNLEPTNKLSSLEERLLLTLDDESLSKLAPKQPPVLGGAIVTNLEPQKLFRSLMNDQRKKPKTSLVDTMTQQSSFMSMQTNIV